MTDVVTQYAVIFDYTFCVRLNDNYKGDQRLWDVFGRISMHHIQMEYTEEKFNDLREKLSADGFDFIHVTRVPHHEPEYLEKWEGSYNDQHA